MSVRRLIHPRSSFTGRAPSPTASSAQARRLNEAARAQMNTKTAAPGALAQEFAIRSISSSEISKSAYTFCTSSWSSSASSKFKHTSASRPVRGFLFFGT